MTVDECRRVLTTVSEKLRELNSVGEKLRELTRETCSFRTFDDTS